MTNKEITADDIQEVMKIIDESVSNCSIGIKKGKYCPGCKKTVGSRTLICMCGFEFKIGEKHEPKKDLASLSKSQQNQVYYSAQFGANITTVCVATPSGPPLFKLETLDDSQIQEWCQKIVEEGMLSNKLYLPQSLQYWLRYFFDINSHEYLVARKAVSNWAKSIIEEYKTNIVTPSPA